MFLEKGSKNNLIIDVGGDNYAFLQPYRAFIFKGMRAKTKRK
jgi:hypothetical protein